MIHTGNDNIEFKTSHLDGHIYQTLFDHEGEQYWIGADYYPISEGFLVCYKAGLAKSWFACSFEYGTSFPDLIIHCAQEDIEQIISEHIEENKKCAAERVLHMAYNVEDDFHAWCHNGNRDFYERFRAFPRYIPHAGKGKSILLRSSYKAANYYYYCHIDEDNKNIQVLGTDSDESFSKICDIRIPDQHHGNYVELIENYYMVNMESLEYLVRTGKVPTMISANPLVDPAITRKMFPPHLGDELILWPDPVYTADIDQPSTVSE